jgi:hypothetical protein
VPIVTSASNPQNLVGGLGGHPNQPMALKARAVGVGRRTREYLTDAERGSPFTTAGFARLVERWCGC